METKIIRQLLCALLLTSALGIKAQDSSSEETYDWCSLPFGAGGFVTGLLSSPLEPGVMYARTDVGGAYRWNDEDDSWEAMTDWISADECGLMGAESMALDPKHANVVYLYLGTSYWSGGLSGIYRSEDYGETFKRMSNVTSLFPAHGNGYGRAAGEMLSVTPWDSDMLFCGSRTRGVWKSKNQGKSWTRVGQTQFPNDTKVAFVQCTEHDSAVYVGLHVKDGISIYVSKNLGMTWQPLEGQPTKYMPHRCTVSQDSIIYFAYTDALGPSMGEQSGALMKYNTYTGEWTDISPIHTSFGDIAVSQANPNYMVAASYSMWWAINWVSGNTQWGDHIYVSRNGGKSWTDLMDTGRARFSEPLIEWAKSGTAQLHWCGSVCLDPFDDQRAFFISGNGIFRSDNIFASSPTFRMAVTGLEMTVPISMANVVGSAVITTLGDVDGCVYKDVNKYTRKHSPAMGTTAHCCIAGQAPQTMVRVKTDAPLIYRTDDSGDKWTRVTGPNDNDEDKKYIYCALSAKGGTLVVTPKNSSPAYTTDGGRTWSTIPELTTAMPVHADRVDDNVFYFYSYSDNTLYTYRLNASSGKMERLGGKVISGVQNAHTMAVIADRAGELWIAQGSGGMVKVTDANTPSPVVAKKSLYQVTCVGAGKAKDEGGYPALYLWGRPSAASKVGLYRSDDEGKKWQRINDDQHQFGGPGNAQFVMGDMNEYGRVFMSTVGRGVIMGQIHTSSDDATDETGMNQPEAAPSQNTKGGCCDLQGRPIKDMACYHGVLVTGNKKYIKR